MSIGSACSCIRLLFLSCLHLHFAYVVLCCLRSSQRGVRSAGQLAYCRLCLIGETLAYLSPFSIFFLFVLRRQASRGWACCVAQEAWDM
ncbi:hypothetical protein BKA65DRAFT_517794 [Rhexocercosporidium sp. MPI-PUGE-AT-0058]|nr:hypothetical protein BKA65DRAFT_517794 [Rhexocercosporidium sp. MPI-PUGE-AT-0058]